MSTFEDLWGSGFPSTIDFDPGRARLLPPPTENAFEWLVEQDQIRNRYPRCLLPFFLECLPEGALPNGDIFFRQLHPRGVDRPDLYCSLPHDEAGALDFAFVGNEEDVRKMMERIVRSGWIMDLLVRGETRRAWVLGPAEEFERDIQEGHFETTPASTLYWLWSSFFFGKDERLDELLQRAARSSSLVVRDAGRVLARVQNATSPEGRRLGTLEDLARLRDAQFGLRSESWRDPSESSPTTPAESFPSMSKPRGSDSCRPPAPEAEPTNEALYPCLNLYENQSAMLERRAQEQTRLR